MKCHECGADMFPTESHLPFQKGPKFIVIVKDVPVYLCGNCSETLLNDSVMKRVEQLVGEAKPKSDIEIVSFAA